MSKEKYCELIDGLCEEFGIENSKSFHEVCDLQVDETTFAFLHGREADPDSFYIYADFGELPASFAALSIQRLLESNLFMYGNNAAAFGVNAATGRVTLMNRVAVSTTTVDALKIMLAGLSTYARLWRKDFMLTDAELELAQPGSS